METISISKFKATCLAVIAKVQRSGESMLVTRRGKPIAIIEPPPVPTNAVQDAFGCMAGTSHEIRDIVEPLSELDWESLSS